MGGAHWRPVSVRSLILGRNRPRMPRHSPFAGTAVAFFLACGGAAALASDASPKHIALSLVGEPKYGADFKHFDWVNPNAPKGGALRQFAEGSFDSLNPIQLQGPEGLRSRAALRFADGRQPGRGIDPVLPDLRVGVLSGRLLLGDLQAAPRGALPATASRSRSRTSSTRCEAQKKANRQAEHYYKNVVKAEKTGEHEVTFTFDIEGQPRAAA